MKNDLALLDRRLAREIKKRPPLFRELALLPDAASLHEPGAGRLRQDAQAAFAPLGKGEPSPLPSPLFAAQGAADRVSYIRAWLLGREAEGHALTAEELLPSRAPAQSRLTYVKNSYADEAYEIFSAHLPEPTVNYVDSFRAACAAVNNGESDYCILPYRTASERLPSFFELAERHALRSVLLCRVFHTDGTDVTHFALYGRAPLPAEPDEERHLCFSMLCTDQALICRHLSAALTLSLHVEELRVLPAPTGEDALLCTMTVRQTHHALFPWLAYLSAFAEGVTYHGYYKELL